MNTEMRVIIILVIALVVLIGLYVFDEYWDYKLDKTKEQLIVCNNQYERLEKEVKNE